MNTVHAVCLLLEKHKKGTSPSAWHSSLIWRRPLIMSHMSSYGMPSSCTLSLKPMSGGSNYSTMVSPVWLDAQLEPRQPLKSELEYTKDRPSCVSFFILIMDTVSSYIQTPHPWSLLYTNDVLLANGQCQGLQEELQRWNGQLEESGLCLNITD